MSTYVISDLHGNYNAYRKMLESIKFSDEDFLYVLGDVLDRGEEPIKILRDIMKRPNVELLAGNHEVMAMECFKFLLQEITEDSIAKMSADDLEMFMNWQENGAGTTLRELRSYSNEQKREMMEYIADCELYEEVEAGGREYLLVHAGLANFSPDREIWDYDLDELVWYRPDYKIPYFEDRFVVAGHTPTMFIEENNRPGYIYSANNHIAIDCGCNHPEGRLGCIRLEDLAEFYV